MNVEKLSVRSGLSHGPPAHLLGTRTTLALAQAVQCRVVRNLGRSRKRILFERHMWVVGISSPCVVLSEGRVGNMFRYLTSTQSHTKTKHTTLNGSSHNSKWLMAHGILTLFRYRFHHDSPAPTCAPLPGPRRHSHDAETTRSSIYRPSA